MNVTELARRAGTTADTVRHYTDLGLLRPTRNPRNRYREYGREDRQRLDFILQARGLGFTLEDVQRILSEAESGQSPCADVRTMIERRLHEVETEIRSLQRLSDRMREAMERWEKQPDTQPGDGRICGLIESMAPGEESRASD